MLINRRPEQAADSPCRRRLMETIEQADVLNEAMQKAAPEVQNFGQ